MTHTIDILVDQWIEGQVSIHKGIATLPSGDTINLRPEHYESWYELEFSPSGENDWYASGERADTLKALKDKLEVSRPFRAGFYLRYIKRTLITEVVR